MKTRGKNIKEWLLVTWDNIKEKSIDFAKDEGIQIASEFVSSVPFVGKTLSRWVKSLGEDSEEFIGNLVKLDESEWEKYEETLDNQLNYFFQTHEKYLEKKFDEVRNDLEQILNEIKKKNTLKAFRSIEYELRRHDKEIKADYIETRFSGPLWVDFEEDYIVEREEVNEIIDNLNNGIQFQLLHGDAASGKSVVARHVGFKLYAKREVFYLNAEKLAFDTYSIKEIEEEIGMLSIFNPLLIIDDIHEHPRACGELFEFIDKNIDKNDDFKGINILGVSRSSYKEEFREKEQNPIDRLCKEKIHIIASNVTDAIIQKYKSIIKPTLTVEEVLVLKESFEHNLWTLMFILDAWEEEKGVDMGRVYEKIAQRMENLNHPDFFGEGATNILLCVAAFYQYELTIPKKFFPKLGFKQKKINKLVEYGYVTKLKGKGPNVFYGLSHSALAETYLSIEEIYKNISDLRDELGEDWTVRLFNKFIQFCEEYSLDLIHVLRRKTDWEKNERAEEYLKKIIKKENVCHFIIGIKSTERDFSDIGMSLHKIYKIDNDIAEDILQKTKVELERLIKNSESFDVLGHGIRGIFLVNPMVAREIVENSREELKILINKSERLFGASSGIKYVTEANPDVGEEILQHGKGRLEKLIKITTNSSEISIAISEINEVNPNVLGELIRDSKKEIEGIVIKVEDLFPLIKLISDILKADLNVGKEIIRNNIEILFKKLTNINDLIFFMYTILEVDKDFTIEIVRENEYHLETLLKGFKNVDDICQLLFLIKKVDRKIERKLIQNIKEHLENEIMKNDDLAEISDYISLIIEADRKVGKEIYRNSKEKIDTLLKESEDIEVIGEYYLKIAYADRAFGEKILRDAEGGLKTLVKKSENIDKLGNGISIIACVDYTIGKELLSIIEEKKQAEVREFIRVRVIPDLEKGIEEDEEEFEGINFRDWLDNINKL